jgi:methyl-accepting chemotaxis protein
VLFVGDILMDVRPTDASHFGDPYTTRGPMYQGLDKLTLNLSVYKDQWGSWISAYRPIVDSAGHQVGAMGIDFTADYVNQVRQGVVDSIGIAFVITYALMFAMVALISQWFTRPLVKLTRITKEVGKGNLNQNFDDLTNSLFPDEIATLTEAYEIALGSVRETVADLTHQVVELQIVIDESQRRKNVSEIVETDFFRDLQAKAQKMRTQRDTKAETKVNTVSAETQVDQPELPARPKHDLSDSPSA